MNSEFSTTLRNGQTVALFEFEGDLVLELVNGNGHATSDITLNDKEIKALKSVINRAENR